MVFWWHYSSTVTSNSIAAIVLAIKTLHVSNDFYFIIYKISLTIASFLARLLRKKVKRCYFEIKVSFVFKIFHNLRYSKQVDLRRKWDGFIWSWKIFMWDTLCRSLLGHLAKFHFRGGVTFDFQHWFRDWTHLSAKFRITLLCSSISNQCSSLMMHKRKCE